MIAFAAAALQLGFSAGAPVKAQSASTELSSPEGITAIAYDYLATFYPLWFTYYQWSYSTTNRFIGPETVTPLYRIVVAINVDTLYASSVISLEADPVVVTLPSTKANYSILQLDPYGNIFETDLDASAGTYVLTGPDYSGSVPLGLTEVEMPLNISFLIIRADKYTSSGDDYSKKADKFRRGITTQTLTDFNDGETPESALIVPVEAFAIPFKSVADFMTMYTPIEFLKLLQTSVHSSNTPTLSTADQKLSDKFDAKFNGGDLGVVDKLKFTAGVIAAKNAIIDTYLDTRGSTNWTHFNNIGAWGDAVFDRSAITEYCQYCNGISTAAYYHAFYDNKGKTLDGSDKAVYTLKFSKKKTPDVSRFWSVTAYTPTTVELVDNSRDKYAVASYTPNLQYGSNKSVTIYMSNKKPSGVKKANWLPVPDGEFNVMLRLYGPEGDVEDYLPPPIKMQ